MSAAWRINRVWLALLAATGLSWALGDSGYAATAAWPWAVPLIFALAAFKGAWVILDFMALRQAPRAWAWLLLGWLYGLCTLLAGLWLAGR